MPAERSWFESWRDPHEFFCTAWEQIKPVTKSDPPQYLREAYVAGLFARIWNYHESCKVRLIAEAERFPDAQLRHGEDTINLEIAIADKEGRPIWKEHKKWAEMSRCGQFVPADSPGKRRADTREAIARIVKQKVKNYLWNRSDATVNVNLLIYCMIAPAITEPGPVITIDEMGELTESYKNNFEAIWLLCRSENVRVWPKRKVLRTPPDQDPFDCRTVSCG